MIMMTAGAKKHNTEAEQINARGVSSDTEQVCSLGRNAIFTVLKKNGMLNAKDCIHVKIITNATRAGEIKESYFCKYFTARNRSQARTVSRRAVSTRTRLITKACHLQRASPNTQSAAARDPITSDMLRKQSPRHTATKFIMMMLWMLKRIFLLWKRAYSRKILDTLDTSMISARNTIRGGRLSSSASLPVEEFPSLTIADTLSASSKRSHSFLRCQGPHTTTVLDFSRRHFSSEQPTMIDLSPNTVPV